MLTNVTKSFQISLRLLNIGLKSSKYQVCAVPVYYVKTRRPISALNCVVSEVLPTSSEFVRLLYTSAFVCKVKGKKDKGAKKIQQLIRPVDAAHVLDLDEVQTTMKEMIENLKLDFAKDFRIGSDIPLEKIEVVIERDTFALNEVAQINKPSPRLIQVDMISFPEFVKVAEDAIRNSKWNLNPSVSGTIIKIPIPQATAEHRATVAKNAKERLKMCKQDLQSIVNNIENDLKQHKNESEDLIRILKQQVKIFCDHFVVEAELIFKGKEKEILHPT